MNRIEELKVLSKGYAQYKKMYEDALKENENLKSQVVMLEKKTEDVMLPAEMISDGSGEVLDGVEIRTSGQLIEFKRKVNDFIEKAKKENADLKNESDVMLRSMTRLSGDLKDITEANSKLSEENKALTSKLQKITEEKYDVQKETTTELLKSKDISLESRLALEKQTKQIEDLTTENDSLKSELTELKEFKTKYNSAVTEISELRVELDMLKRSTATSTFVTDGDDDSLLITE